MGAMMEAWLADALLRIIRSVPIREFDAVTLGTLYDLAVKAGRADGRGFDWERRAWAEPSQD